MSQSKEPIPYGSWPSSLSAADVAEGMPSPEWLGFVGDEVWWTESLAHDGGRSALMRRAPDGVGAQVLPPGWDVRTRLHEYGARPWRALSAHPADGIVFTHWTCLLYTCRYGDFAVRGDEAWCVRETIRTEGDTPAQVHRDLVALPLDGRAAGDRSAVRVLASTHDFMTGPRIEPGGRRVAWIGWNHPAMPWDSTDLMVAEISPDGTLHNLTRALDGGRQQSVTQAEWAADGSGRLYAVTDPEGWWNLYEVTPGGPARNLCPLAEEFGEALWRMGTSWFQPLSDGGIAVVHGTSERRLGILAPDGDLTDLGPGGQYTQWSTPATDGHRIAAVAAGPDHRPTVVLVEPHQREPEPLRTDRRTLAATPYLRTYHGPDGEPVHAHVHPPHHPRATNPDGELPPFVVFAHGGPTNRSPLVPLDHITYFTSRGIGVLDVQYGGSTGFGRAYRDRLRGAWGVVDVQDCAAAARGIVADGLADPDRIAIRGASAGGWTAAASLIAEPDLYRAAAIYFPVLDADTWRRTTHDFESRYAETLIGPWPKSRELYEQRSPVHRADRIRAPFVLFQGTEDAICPPGQAEQFLKQLEGSDTPYTHRLFEGEGHGFRGAATVIHTLQAELALYSRVFGFHLAPE
ncbi:alpha/beta hydrolase family protein [Streptomyces resistomycificus]|uniref:alpha/beta hydrolase family protein n=1 Tax=Streptomyces resistomycificus TaxID=67356 RepID=UPI0004AA4615|nr:prolyl oligopeptidase family serine peptidase [Streptomyces resistomycificus]